MLKIGTRGKSAFVALSALLVASCGGGPSSGTVANIPLPSQQATTTPAPAPANDMVVPVNFSEQAYRLGNGDELRVIVYGEDDLSGDFTVDSEGHVSLPLVGQVQAGGRTLREFEAEVARALSQGYLLDPRVSAEVLNFRPFYIIGEVNSGGEYPYSQGMTVLNAVAIAGGYSYRADRRKVFITRENQSEERQFGLESGVPVYPGDVIRVPERFF